MGNMRAKGSGTKRADGRWQTPVTVTTPDNGKHRKMLYADTQRELMEKKAKALAGGRRAPYPVTVAQLVQFCRERRWPELRPKTVASYEWAAARIVSALGSRRLADLGPPDVSKWLRQMADETDLSGRSIQMCRNVLGVLMREAMEQGWATSNPAKDVRIPRPATPQTRRRIGRAEIERLIRSEPNLHRRLLWDLMAATALRPVEALSLERGDVVHEMDSWWVCVRSSKTAAGIRQIPVDDDLAQSLMDLLPFPNRDVSKAGKAWNAAQRRVWREDADHAESLGRIPPPYEQTNLYQLRKYRLSQWVADGLPDEIVKALAGHTDIAVTKNVYVGVDVARLRVAAAPSMSGCMSAGS